MPLVEDIESQLAAIDNWTHVSFKENLLGSLNRVLSDGETVEDVLEGFYKGTVVTGSGTGAAGILCITDRRLLFMQNGRSAGRPEIINFADVASVSYRTGIAATKVYVNTAAGSTILTTNGSGTQVQSFTELLQDKADVAHGIDPETEEPTAPEPGTAPDVGTGAPTDADADRRARAENLKFLVDEARKMFTAVNEYRNFNGEPGFLNTLVDDILYLSYLAVGNNPTVSDEAKLFVSIVVMPLRQTIVEDRDLVFDLFRYDSLPLHQRRAILRYWDRFRNEIKKNARRQEGMGLRALAYLRNYDQEHNSSHFDRTARVLFGFVQVLSKADGTAGEDTSAFLKRVRILIYGESEDTTETQTEKKKPRTIRRESPEDETIEDILAELDSLIGMAKIKEQIATFVNLMRIHQEREKRDLPVTPMTKHAVFYGPPGTGKTTIARYLGRIYKALGMLESGHLVETDRAGMVAGFVGQTATKVDEVVESAMDGVLFIDEAYSLASRRSGGNDFGQEAIDTLIKRMEDLRDRMAVIVAGYPDEMQEFINSNPGLKSRFSRYFYFEHYDPKDLGRIFDLFASNASFTLTKPARGALRKLILEFYGGRDKAFGNGRLMRNIFEKAIERQADRIARLSPLTEEILCTITKADIPARDDFVR